MAKSFFGWKNNIQTSSLTTAGGEPAALGAANLFNDQGSPSMAWQTAGTTAHIVMGNNVATTYRVLALFRTNLTAAATIRWQINTGYDSGVVSAGIVPTYQQSITILSADTAGQSVTLDVSDPTNPDGFINIPLVYIGPGWFPIVGPSSPSTEGRDDASDEVVTRGGQEFPVFRFARRRWSVVLDAVAESESYAQLFDLDRVARMDGNVLFVPYADGTDIAKQAVFGRCKPTADMGYAFGGATVRSWKGNFTERL